MGLLSSIGKAIKRVATFDISKFAKGEKVITGTIPFGAGVAGIGKGLLGAFKALPTVGKAIKGFLTATLLGGAIAGGGAAIIPKLFAGAKKGAEILTGDEPVTQEDIPDVLKVAGLGGLAGLLTAGALLLPAALGQPSLETLPLPVAGAGILPTEAGAAVTPVTPETQIIDDKPKKVTRKRAIQPRRTTIRQQVDVRVGVNAANKKFIKNIVLN